MTPFNITNPGIGGLDEITSTEEAILLSIATFGSAGQVLTVNGTEDGVEWTAAGSGDVTKVGTPANNQIGVWTGDGTIEGDASLTWDGTSFNIATAKNFQIAGSTILADAAGTTTLSNIDALDATTEATIEAAIDTLANLTSIQGRTVTLADAGANAIFGWDDTAGAYENLSQAEVRTVLGLGTAAYVATDLADLNEATIEGAIDTLANLTSVQGQTISLSAPLTVPADPGADRIFFWDDSETATAWLSLGNSVAITTTTLDTIQDIRTTASPQFAGVNVGDASDTTITRASAGVIAVEGNEVVVSNRTATRTLVLTAAGGKPTTTSGCAAAALVEAGTNDVDYWVLDFDASTKEYAVWNVVMPDSYDGGTVTATFIWTTSSSTTTHTAVWGLAARAFGNDDAIDQAYGTAQEVSDDVIASGDVHITSATSAITIAGTPAGGKLVIFRAYRDPANGSDDLNVDARLIAIKVEYGINAYSD